MTFLDDNDRFVIAHVRGLGTATLASPRAPWRRTCSSLTALLPIFRFLPPADKRSTPLLPRLRRCQADSSCLPGCIRGRIPSPPSRASGPGFSGSQGEPIGQEVQVNTTTTGDRFSACAATIVVPGGQDGLCRLGRRQQDRRRSIGFCGTRTGASNPRFRGIGMTEALKQTPLDS